jgi:hypothetical protein
MRGEADVAAGTWMLASVFTAVAASLSLPATARSGVGVARRYRDQPASQRKPHTSTHCNTPSRRQPRAPRPGPRVGRGQEADRGVGLSGESTRLDRANGVPASRMPAGRATPHRTEPRSHFRHPRPHDPAVHYRPDRCA